MTTTAPGQDTFVQQWNALDRSERKYLRRLVRLGRPIDDPHLAGLASTYAEFQCNRVWMRLFWLWFVPGMFLVLGGAVQVHPIFLGVAIAVGAQAVFAHYNLRKAARPAAAPA